MKIVITGLQRSGSTLTWQVVNEISKIRPYLNINLSKSHGDAKIDDYDYIISTYRDIRDIVISFSNSLFNTEQNKDKSINDRINMSINEIEPYFNKFMNTFNLNSSKVILIKYEDFLPDNISKLTSFIFDKIKKDNDTLTESELNDISYKLSIDSNKKLSNNFKDFKQYDKESLIHGDHITSDGRSNNWDDNTFSEDNLRRMYPMLKKLNYIK